MMTLLVGFLTALMVIDCLLLILLVLVQLPKKEAGAGMAFGGAATDALFGAGSGNTLTMITKWVAGAFFVLALTLSLLKTHQVKTTSAIEEALKRQSTAKPTATQPAAPVSKPSEAPMLLTNQIVTTNLPAATNK